LKYGLVMHIDPANRIGS